MINFNFNISSKNTMFDIFNIIFNLMWIQVDILNIYHNDEQKFFLFSFGWSHESGFFMSVHI